MSVTCRTLLGALLLLAGCDLFGDSSSSSSGCSRDQDCPSPQRCYVDGCGLLPDDLLAEVTSSGLQGSSSVDLPLGPATATSTLILPPSQGLQLSVHRGGGPYKSSVQLLASGESVLLAGVTRVAQTAGARVSGVFPVSLSTGRYTVVVSPLDPAVPPATSVGLVVDAGVTSLTLDLLDAAQVETLTGTVLAAPGTPEPAPPDVQLLAPDGRPLSARRTADVAGGFQLSVGAEGLDAGAVLQVTPAAGVLGAVATFPVSDPGRFSRPFLVGDAATPVTVSGTLLAPDGSPVARASVSVQGTVVGGGAGNAGPVTSGDDGSFSLQTLPQSASGTLALWAIPPPGSTAGLLRTSIEVPPGARVTGTWTCPSRPLLRGTFLLPDAGPLAGATLRADPVAPADPATPLPAAGSSGLTGESGGFTMRLDPAVYRLEVQPGLPLPPLRRFVQVSAGGSVLDKVTVPGGRTLTAQVRRSAGAPVSGALVRIYRRVLLDDGTPRALFLGEGTSDQEGVVSILLPQQ